MILLGISNSYRTRKKYQMCHIPDKSHTYVRKLDHSMSVVSKNYYRTSGIIRLFF